MVLISNVISKAKYNLGLGKTGLNSEVVLILGGLNRDVLQTVPTFSNLHTIAIRNIIISTFCM